MDRRDDAAPPAAPPAPKFPEDGAAVTGTKPTFEWEQPKGEEKIADYWLELSDRPDMRWPLSPNFEKLIGRTKQAGSATWEVPYEGLLNPGQPYYWHVRAKTETGVWGPWSKTWSFTVKAPAPPVHVKMNWDKDERVLTLSWEGNPEGERPAKYIVYGSDEKGFTASDEAYEVNGGKAGTLKIEGNRVAETAETSYAILPIDGVASDALAGKLPVAPVQHAPATAAGHPRRRRRTASPLPGADVLSRCCSGRGRLAERPVGLCASAGAHHLHSCA